MFIAFEIIIIILIVASIGTREEKKIARATIENVCFFPSMDNIEKILIESTNLHHYVRVYVSIRVERMKCKSTKNALVVTVLFFFSLEHDFVEYFSFSFYRFSAYKYDYDVIEMR